MHTLARLRFLGATMLGAWLTLNLLMYALAPLTRAMHPLASTAVVVPPMVLLMVYVIIPVAKRAGGVATARASHEGTTRVNTHAEAYRPKP